MPVVRQQYVIHQVEILVEEGVAKFDPPLAINGLKTIRPRNGWVPLDTLSGHVADATGELEDLEDQPVNGRGQSIDKYTTKKKREEDENHRCSLDRAKESLSHHQFYTLKRLEKDGVQARLRISSFERRDTLVEVKSSLNVPIYDESDDSED